MKSRARKVNVVQAETSRVIATLRGLSSILAMTADECQAVLERGDVVNYEECAERACRQFGRTGDMVVPKVSVRNGVLVLEGVNCVTGGD